MNNKIIALGLSLLIQLLSHNALAGKDGNPHPTRSSSGTSITASAAVAR